MEIKKDLHSYIVCFDNVMPEEILKSFEKICRDSKKFKIANIVYSGTKTRTVDEKIRKTASWCLSNHSKDSLTEVHWTNFFINIFTTFIADYQKIINSHQSCEINDIQVLKYGKGGHYKFHTDHNLNIPREFSCIFLTNDNYEGGELVFKYPNSEDTTKIDKKKNRIIIWPSNFLYPHSVFPVTKGERYSVVAWAS